MVSESSKKREKERKALAAMKRMGVPRATSLTLTAAPPPLVCTGDLADAGLFFKDIKVENLTLSHKGECLITNCNLSLRYGRFYGIIPSSVSDVSLLFKAMTEGLYPFPSYFEASSPIYNPDRGNLSVKDYVASLQDIKEQIESEQQKMAIVAGDSEAMCCLSDRLEAFGECDNEYATQILYGLGFDKEMQSGVADSLPSIWQKTLALARTLHLRPQVMLIDEPTHFLDPERSLWLVKYMLDNLKGKCIVIIKSNDEDFLSELCTENCIEFIHLKDSKVQQFHGSYDQFALSKAVIPLANLVFREPLNRNLAPPYLQLADASFHYDKNDDLILEEVNLDITLHSRIALVGSKGSGKSTLLKLLRGDKDHTLTAGRRLCNPSLSIGYFHPQLMDELDLNISPMEHVSRVFQGKRLIMNEVAGLEHTEIRKPIRNLSPGQKTLLVLSCLALEYPDLLLVDEPCEHLDVETIASIGTALRSWKGSFILATSNVALINMAVCNDVWLCGSKGLSNHLGDIMHLKQKMLDHTTKMADIRNPAKSRSTYPQFAIPNFADVAHPAVHYHEYVDDFSERFKSGCIPLADFIKKRPMVALAPCKGLNKGDMDFPHETDPTKKYHMTTDPGRRVGRSLLGDIHFAEEAGECFGDFDITNLMVTSTGTIRLKGVKRKRSCPNQLRRNHLSAHKVIKDMCSAGGAVPEDVQLLLDMIEFEPELSPLYHTHYSMVPIYAISPFFTKMYEKLLRDIKDTNLVDQILLEIPYLGTDQELINGNCSGVWHQLATSNGIIMKTYNFAPGLFSLKPLKLIPPNVAITPQQLKARKIKEAKNLLNCLRNRVAHRLDYNHGVMQYTARASDLASHARYCKVGCILQKELHKAKETKDLDLHEFSLEKI